MATRRISVKKKKKNMLALEYLSFFVNLFRSIKIIYEVKYSIIFFHSNKTLQ